jgi:hypothetical protein
LSIPVSPFIVNRVLDYRAARESLARSERIEAEDRAQRAAIDAQERRALAELERQSRQGGDALAQINREIAARVRAAQEAGRAP